MEKDESMILRDLPVDTRNYTIIDNVTGKPIDDSNYSLTIDTEVIAKLNKLKEMNEEKVRQSALKSQYTGSSTVDTFTPEDNSVFTPVYSGEYINEQDFNTNLQTQQQEIIEEEKTEDVVQEKVEEPNVIVQDTLLERVVARDPNEKQEEISQQQTNESNQNTQQPAENGDEFKAGDGMYTPDNSSLHQASEQIINIETERLGKGIKPPKHKNDDDNIRLDQDEIAGGRGFAWLAYILFFIPLLFNRNNRFVRIHANEGLELNIMEILGALLMLPMFLLKDLTGTLQLVVTIIALVGGILLTASLLTIIPMMISSLLGHYKQNPWLWKKRIIKVHTNY